MYLVQLLTLLVNMRVLYKFAKRVLFIVIMLSLTMQMISVADVVTYVIRIFSNRIYEKYIKLLNVSHDDLVLVTIDV